MIRLITIILVIFILTSCSEKEKKSFCLEDCECDTIEEVPSGTWGDSLNSQYTYQLSYKDVPGIVLGDTYTLTLSCVDVDKGVRRFKYEQTIFSSWNVYEETKNIAYKDTVFTIPLGTFNCKRVVSKRSSNKVNVLDPVTTGYDTIYYSEGHGIIRKASWTFQGSSFLSANFEALIKIED